MNHQVTTANSGASWEIKSLRILFHKVLLNWLKNGYRLSGLSLQRPKLDFRDSKVWYSDLQSDHKFGSCNDIRLGPFLVASKVLDEPGSAELV
jgi:hypothetical protein